MQNRKVAVLAALLATEMLCGGCRRVQDADVILRETVPATAQVFTEEETALPEFSADGIDPYANVVQYYLEQYQEAATDGETALQPIYLLYDMDKDGTLELILRTGNNEADFLYTIWTADADGQPIQIEGTADGAHASVYGAESQIGFFVNSCHGETQTIRQYTVTEGNTLTETEIYSGVIPEDVEIDYYDLTADKDFVRIDEQNIEDYRYHESPTARDAKTSQTLEEYRKQLEQLESGEAVG